MRFVSGPVFQEPGLWQLVLDMVLGSGPSRWDLVGLLLLKIGGTPLLVEGGGTPLLVEGGVVITSGTQGFTSSDKLEPVVKQDEVQEEGEGWGGIWSVCGA